MKLSEAWDFDGEDAVDRVPPCKLLSVGTGVGKSHQARQRVAELCRDMPDGHHLVFAVPTHVLASEHQERLQAELTELGLSVAVYRGREATNPDTGTQMCAAAEAVKTALIGGADPKTLCSRGRGTNAIRCKHYSGCGYREQMSRQAQVWLAPHALLTRACPEAIRPVSALIIDEDPHSEFLNGGQISIYRDELRTPVYVMRSEFERDDFATADIEAVRSTLVALFDSVEDDGKVPVSLLAKAGLDAETVGAARKALLRTKVSFKPRPNMSREDIEREFGRDIQHNRKVLKIARLLSGIGDAFGDSGGIVPGLRVLRNAKTRDGGTADQVFFRPRSSVHPSWSSPTVIMTATGDPELLRFDFPIDEVLEAHPTTPHAHVIQHLWSASAAKLKNERNLLRLKHFVEVQAARHRGTGPIVDGQQIDLLLIAQKAVIEDLSGALPGNVDVGWFNGCEGIDKWRNVPCAIIAGRTMPRVSQTVNAAEVLSRADVDADPTIHQFKPAAAGIYEASSGRVRTTQAEHHPVDVVERLRWQVAEAGQMQAVGRVRAARRTAENPVEIHVISTLPLPIRIDEVREWEQSPDYVVEVMAARGLMISPKATKGIWDVVRRVLPDVFSTAKAAKSYFDNHSLNVLNAIKSIYSKWDVERFVHASIKLPETRYAVAVLIDPDLGEPRATAERLLGPLDQFEADCGSPRQYVTHLSPPLEDPIPAAPLVNPPRPALVPPWRDPPIEPRPTERQASTSPVSYFEIVDEVSGGGFVLPEDERQAINLWLRQASEKTLAT